MKSYVFRTATHYISSNENGGTFDLRGGPNTSAPALIAYNNYIDSVAVGHDSNDNGIFRTYGYDVINNGVNVGNVGPSGSDTLTLSMDPNSYLVLRGYSIVNHQSNLIVDSTTGGGHPFLDLEGTLDINDSSTNFLNTTIVGHGVIEMDAGVSGTSLSSVKFNDDNIGNGTTILVKAGHLEFAKPSLMYGTIEGFGANYNATSSPARADVTLDNIGTVSSAFLTRSLLELFDARGNLLDTLAMRDTPASATLYVTNYGHYVGYTSAVLSDYKPDLTGLGQTGNHAIVVNRVNIA